MEIGFNAYFIINILLLDEPTGDLDTRSTDIAMKILVDCSKREGSDWEFAVGDASTFDLNGDHEDWIRELRAERLDVRSHLTNQTIKKGTFRVCYPFALPAERLDCVLIRAA